MDFYYFKSNPENFGDALNKFLWPKVFKNLDQFSEDSIFLGIGTILNKKLLNSEVENYKNIHVFGSGAGYGDLPMFDDKWKFSFVRGPLTAKSINKVNVKYITDPANLVQHAFQLKVKKIHKVSFIPHHESLSFFDWNSICDTCGINYIDPSRSVPDVLNAIAGTDLLICEAMHGAIVADALRVPWVPVKCYRHILDFKWRDWAETVGINYSPIHVNSLYVNTDGDNWREVFKVKIKRKLKGIGLWNKGWALPKPPASKAEDIEKACKVLSSINSSNSFLSLDSVNMRNLNHVLSEVDNFNAEFKK